MEYDRYLKLKGIVADFNWQEAKTMRDKPHSYNVKAKNQNKEQFVFYGEVLLVAYAKYLLEYLKPLVK